MCEEITRVPKENLEIYKKAQRFKGLSLISGNNVGDIEKYVSANYGQKGKMRLKLARFLLNSLGYQESPDVLLMLACNKRAKVVIATAGAGKTTSLQFDIVISKMIDLILDMKELAPQKIEGTEVEVSRILYLNYNRHNKEPILKKHSEVCARVNSLIQEHINDDIESDTVHAFCKKWLQVFLGELDEEGNIIEDDDKETQVVPVDLISEKDKTELWESIAVPRWKRFYGSSSMQVSIETLDELYNFRMESMMDWDALFETSKFVDTGLKQDFLKSCLTKYDSMKRMLKKYDFIDFLQVMVNLLKQYPIFKERLQNRYSLIIADENQDFTALMNELLLQLYNPKKNRLVVVGDPDQVIYSFKGVSPENMVGLVERLEDVELLGLDTNYRCPDEIIKAAKHILDLNIMRFEKPLRCVRTGGKIVEHPYKLPADQPESVIRVLERLGPENYKGTVVCYRNNRSAIVMGEELYYAGVPFKVLDVYRPFNNPFFRHIYGALMALREKDNITLNEELFRVLPVTRATWKEILELNKKHRHMHLHDMGMPANGPKGLMESFALLVEISRRIETYKCVDYVNVLLSLYLKYHFNFILKGLDRTGQTYELYQLYFERLKVFFNRPLTFDYMVKELAERNRDNPNGVTMATFHGLKGLEFDYVIATDFNETVFPDWWRIESKYGINTAMEEKEAENRLAYVLVTRTIKELHLFYLARDPSVYVDVLKGVYVEGSWRKEEDLNEGTMADGGDNSKEVALEVEEPSCLEGEQTSKGTDLQVTEQPKKFDNLQPGTIVGGPKSVESKLDFIRRMTTGRK